MSETYGPEYYANVYRNYRRQNPSAKLRFYRRLLEAHVRGDAPKVLDVGCAFGDFLASLPANWPRWGIDASEYAIRQARQTRQEISFAAAVLEGNPFQGPFDAITCFDVIEHIGDLRDVRNTIRELLAPSGVFMFVVPVYDGPLGWLVRLLDPDPTHIHKERRQFWLDWAADGFAVEEWKGIFRYLTPFGFYAHWPTGSLRQYSPAIAVVAQKR